MTPLISGKEPRSQYFQTYTMVTFITQPPQEIPNLVTFFEVENLIFQIAKGP